jgi:signal transduction histidine kinase
MQKSPYDISIFLIVTSILFVTLTVFIIIIILLYKKSQIRFEQSLAQIRLNHEKMILSTQLEIQEETFRHISKEIHDNINLSLTLAKLNLNTLNLQDVEFSSKKITNSIDLLSRSIGELSDISKSLNADIIINHGLLKAIEDEISKINQIGIFELNYRLIGNTAFLDAQKELIIFRIIQEGFNNIIKHSNATSVGLTINYKENSLEISLNDNGSGFELDKIPNKREAGISNMTTRVNSLNGSININSVPGKGTTLSFTIPI